ncbi:uncharacterized protein VNE69_05004 [Vairimorpha necatrix]|uniref:Membrane protein n=1 Tax=Vairimorpha necatrix TaxID=6039 RepID=A0AAX4JBZ1_9MICR
MENQMTKEGKKVINNVIEEMKKKNEQNSVDGLNLEDADNGTSIIGMIIAIAGVVLFACVCFFGIQCLTSRLKKNKGHNSVKKEEENDDTLKEVFIKSRN